MKSKNIAVIAHVDHGKTTLVDNLLKLIEKMSESMDNNALERERGITILSKCTGIIWKNEKINIVDTPGHSDFGGEVERIMSMVEAALVIVDAVEGVKPQTRFVIDKAIKKNLHIIIFINKMDRDGAKPVDTLLATLEIMHNMGYKGDIYNIPVLYGSGRDGWAVENAEDSNSIRHDLGIVLDYILRIPSTKSFDDTKPFSMFVSLIERNEFLGRLLIGCIHSGSIKEKQEVYVLNLKNEVLGSGRVTKIFTFQGMQKLAQEQSSAGEIIALAIAGLQNIASATHTVCTAEVTQALSGDPISPPTMSIVIGVNNSPTCGKDGIYVTSNKIRERLLRETEGNVSIQIKEYGSESFEIFGRGELQLGILLENMRREGFELLVYKPKVVLRIENGMKFEPVEKVYICVDVEYNGFVMEELNNRSGILLSVEDNITIFKVPTRGLMGFYSKFISRTNGTGTIDREFYGYEEYKGEIKTNRYGSLVSMEDGIASAYALNTLQQRGSLFIAPGDLVYKGMIIGENSREGDMEVNPTKSKQLTNMRAAGKDEFIQLTPPKKYQLEELLNRIFDDEALEMTPKIIRTRKIILDKHARQKSSK